jgi:hypothetical protein
MNWGKINTATTRFIIAPGEFAEALTDTTFTRLLKYFTGH